MVLQFPVSWNFIFFAPTKKHSMHKTQSHTHTRILVRNKQKLLRSLGVSLCTQHSDCLIVVLSIHSFFGWQSFIFIVMFCGSCAKQIKRARCLSREREYTAFSFIVVFDLYNTQLASWGSLFIMAIIKIIITCSTYTHKTIGFQDPVFIDDG